MLFRRKKRAAFDAAPLIAAVDRAIELLKRVGERIVINEHDAPAILEERCRASACAGDCIATLEQCRHELSVTLSCRASERAAQGQRLLGEKLDEILECIRSVSVYYGLLERSVYPRVKQLLAMIRDLDTV